jgi:Zn-dependent protease
VVAAILLHGLAGGGAGYGVLNILYTGIQINIVLFVFNMVPIPPLDGSRLLYAFAPEPLQDIMRQLEQYGVLIVFALLLLVPAFSILLTNLNQALLNFLI